jgi:hypothetical protein
MKEAKTVETRPAAPNWKTERAPEDESVAGAELAVVCVAAVVWAAFAAPVFAELEEVLKRCHQLPACERDMTRTLQLQPWPQKKP